MVGQGISLVVASAFVILAGGSRQLPGATAATGPLRQLITAAIEMLSRRGKEALQPLPGDDTALIGRFVLLVCFWILALAACARLLLRGRNELRGDAAAAAARAAAPEGNAASRRGKQGTPRSSVKIPKSNESGRPPSRCLWALAQVGCSALGAVAVSAALAALAVWVLTEFLPGRPGARLAVLLYWAALLGIVLPLMYRVLHPPRASSVAQAGMKAPVTAAVPHILLRKGYHVLALLLFVPVLLLDPAMMQVRGREARVSGRVRGRGGARLKSER